jgi:hypothetical protein
VSDHQKFVLIQTCSGCPEQYDVYLNKECVGYLRLRHGSFTANVFAPKTACTWEEVYSASPAGDGIFEPDERERYLNEACYAIRACIEKKPREQLPVIFEIGTKIDASE